MGRRGRSPPHGVRVEKRRGAPSSSAPSLLGSPRNQRKARAAAGAAFDASGATTEHIELPRWVGRFRFVHVIWVFVATRAAMYISWLDADETVRNFAILDSTQYLSMADQVASGDVLLGTAPLIHGPLYAFFLVPFYATGGLALVYLAQIGLSALNVRLLYELGRRILSEPAGLFGSLAFTLYGAAALLEFRVLPSTLGLSLLLLALLYSLPGRGGGWQPRFKMGLLWGLSVLARPALLPLVPLAFVWVLPLRSLFDRKRRLAARGLEILRRFTPVVGGACLILAPVTLRNLYSTGEPTLVSTHGGVTFYQGNHERAVGVYSQPAELPGDPQRIMSAARDIASKELGYSLGPGAVSNFFLEKGATYLWQHPAQWTSLWLRKLALELGNDELSAEYTLGVGRRLLPALWLVPVPFALLLGGAILGFKRRYCAGKSALLILVLVWNVAMAVLFFFASRYRVPGAAVLSLFFGQGVFFLLTRAVSRLRAFAALAVSVLSLVSWSGIATNQEAAELASLGYAHQEIGRMERARDYYQEAVALRPSNAEFQFNLGLAHAKLLNWTAAKRGFEKTLTLDPAHRRARQGLLVCVQQLGP